MAGISSCYRLASRPRFPPSNSSIRVRRLRTFPLHSSDFSVPAPKASKHRSISTSRRWSI